MSEDKEMKGRKGQIFTLDVLAALIAVTLIMGVTLHYQTEIKNTQSLQANREMRTIAGDAAQIAIKNILAEEGRANTIDENKVDELNTFMDQFIPAHYHYEVQGTIEINPGTCGTAERAVNSRRIVKNSNGNIDTLTVVICR